MRRKIRMCGVALVAGAGLALGGCAYHGGGYYSGHYGGHCHGNPAGAVIVGTAALFYAIGNACH